VAFPVLVYGRTMPVQEMIQQQKIKQLSAFNFQFNPQYGIMLLMLEFLEI
jgi:hypothetical protein